LLKDKSTIIFDFDGTIADTLDILVHVYNDNARKLGLPEAAGHEIVSWRAKSARELLRDMHIPIFLLPLIQTLAVWQLKKHVNDMHPFPGIKDLLIALSKHYKLGILTSNSKSIVYKFLENNNLEMFKFVYSGRNIFGKDKLLRKLLKYENLEAAEVIYVGDEVRDIEACQKVGIEIISVNWGYNNPEALSGLQPSYSASTAAEVGKILLS